MFKLGIELIHMGRYDMASNVFFKLVKQDSVFCDAYFFMGYTERLRNHWKLAFDFYRMADGMANHKAIEFKQNLAYAALTIGEVDYARKKFEEIVQYFPKSPEGYYGIALTAAQVGDTKNGLANINRAIAIYDSTRASTDQNEFLIKGILLTQSKKYEEGLESFERVSADIAKREHYKIYKSVCLLKVAEQKGDEKMKKQARKLYDKIKNKEDIPEDARSLLVF